MTEQDVLERIRRESYGEIHRDGLTEVAVGILLFIVAFATGRPAFYWTFLLALLVLSPGLERFRSRYTYPRIGFAALPRKQERRLGRVTITWVVVCLVLFVLGLAATGSLGDNLAWRRMAPVLAGVLTAGGLLHLATQSGLKRVYALAMASVIAGICFAWRDFGGEYSNVRIWALVMALLCLSVGGVAFRRFLIETPTAEE